MQMKADISGCLKSDISEVTGLNVMHLCRYDICIHTPTCIHSTCAWRERYRKRTMKRRLSFPFTHTHLLYINIHRQIQNRERTYHLSGKKDSSPFRSFKSVLSLSLDYQIIPTLLFSTGILRKVWQLLNLQVKLDGFITWHNFQIPQMSLQSFWFHGKFTRLTFRYMTEF